MSEWELSPDESDAQQSAQDERDSYLCNQCDGSGEGMVDGSTCIVCKGVGEVVDEEEEE